MPILSARKTSHTYEFKTKYTSADLLEKLRKSLRHKFRNHSIQVEYNYGHNGYAIESQLEIGKKLEAVLAANLDKWIADIGNGTYKRDMKDKATVERNLKNVPTKLFTLPKNGATYPGLDALYGLIMHNYGRVAEEVAKQDYGQARMYWDDMMDLHNVQALVDRGNIKTAFEIARRLDTAIREDIPTALWNLMLATQEAVAHR